MSRYIEWKAIEGYEGLYEVSNTGEIRNAKGKTKKSSLKKGVNTNYKEISLWKDGKNKRFLVHRLVAKTFIPSPNNYPIINHKDENGTNNCVENLEWCNHRYNARYNKYPEKPNTIPSKVVSREQKQKTSISVKKYRREHSKLKFEYNGEMLSIPEIAEKTNVRQGTLWQRYCRTGSIFLGAKMDGERSEMERKELKPCECGGKCEVLSLRLPSDDDCLYYHNLYYVECTECGKTSEDYSQTECGAIKEWNRRANDGT